MNFLQAYLLIMTATVGLKHEAIVLCIDYFLYRNVKLICVLDCVLENVGNTAFTRAANSHHMFVTIVDIDLFNNTSNVEKCLHQELSAVGVVLNAKCEAVREVFLLASEKMMFDENHMWLIIEENNVENSTVSVLNETLTTTVNVLSTLNISVNADVLLATTTTLQEYMLNEVYNFGKIQGGDLILNEVGSWNIQSGLELDINGYKYYKRWDFQQWQMRMIFVMSPIPDILDPSLLTDRKPTPSLTTFTKTTAMVLHVISEIHNFKFKYTASDRWIGTYEINSSRVVANSLYFREQDISPVLRYQPNLIQKLDLLYPPLTSLETRYYYRIPTKGPGKLENQFLRPLSEGAWLCVVAVCALCGVILLASAAFERRHASAQYAVFSVIATICQQFFEDVDDGNIRSSAARKVTILVTGLSCVLIYNYYTSSVVSWLLSGPPPSITSLQELLDSPLELLFEDVGYTRSWLQTPNYYYNRRNAKIEDELRKKVYKRGYSSPPLVPLEKGIAMVKAGGYAYHTETDRANDIISRTFTQSELCEMGSLQSMEKTRLYPVVQYRSPYKEFFVWSLLRLMERGVVSCIQQRTDSPSVECEGSSPRALALGGAAPAFILLAAGCGLATIIMLVERLQIIPPSHPPLQLMSPSNDSTHFIYTDH